jgi:large-conductance mechanosensitive channel
MGFGYNGAGKSLITTFVGAFLGFSILAFIRFLIVKGFKSVQKLDDRLSEKKKEKGSQKPE